MARTAKYFLIIFSFLSAVFTSSLLLAQYDNSRGDQPEAEFHMARLIYSPSTNSNRGNWRQMWAIDYPSAEYHFTQGVRRLTHINTAGDSIHLQPTDDRIFDYPWLFAQQVGTWSLNNSEALHLREYLLRGGFLIVDDFHGNYEWMIFTNSIRQVFPDRPIVDLEDGEEILHVFYDLDRNTQIPGRRHLYRGMSGQIDAQMHGPATWRGIYDDDGRLMVAINFNMDMGDAWEHADDPVYPEPMTALAYRFGINYLIYAFTH
ncbi:MAG: DUF4159 domain-containing protein [Gammaproteobacteria bacterium]|nr:DUF4159 domain-containing protein [Gammaproteobacteria bacterium]